MAFLVRYQPILLPTTGEISTWYPRTWLLIIALIGLATHGFFSILGVATVEGANHLLVMLALWATAALAMTRHARSWVKALVRDKLIIIFPLLALISTAWSLQPRSTISTATYLILSTGFAVAFSYSFTPLQQMRLVLAAGSIAAFGSLMLAVVYPSAGLDSHADIGAVQGIYLGKNVCALSTAFFLLPVFFYPARTLRERCGCWLYAGANLLIITLTRSRTTLIMTIAIAAIALAFKVLRRVRRPDVLLPLIISLCFCLVIGILTVSYKTEMLSWLARDASLNGRGPLWEILTVIIQRRPWLGYGYNGFWADNASSEVNTYVQWTPGYAHNGFFEVLLGVGGVGLFVVLLLLLRTFRDGLIVFYRLQSSFVDWYIAVLLLTIAYNFDEGFLEAHSNITWFLFLVASIMLSRIRRDRNIVSGSHNVMDLMAISEA